MLHNLEIKARDKDGPPTLQNIYFALDGFEVKGLKAVNLYFRDDDVNAASIKIDLEEVEVDEVALLFLEGYVDKSKH